MTRQARHQRRVARSALFYVVGVPALLAILALEHAWHWLRRAGADPQQDEIQHGDQGGMPVLILRGGERPAPEARQPAGATPDSASRRSPQQRLAAFYENEGM